LEDKQLAQLILLVRALDRREIAPARATPYCLSLPRLRIVIDGGEVSAQETAHLETCDSCRGLMRRFERTPTELARLSIDDETFELRGVGGQADLFEVTGLTGTRLEQARETARRTRGTHTVHIEWPLSAPIVADLSNLKRSLRAAAFEGPLMATPPKLVYSYRFQGRSFKLLIYEDDRIFLKTEG